MFLIVACSSHPFLLTPLSFVCLTLLLSIWPAIDKTQSLTILGVLHRIGGDGALCIVASVCLLRLQERDGMQLTSLFIYLQLPDGAHQKECVSQHTHSLSHSLFPPLVLSSISPMALLSIWTGFLVQNMQHEVRGKQVRLPGRQDGTWEGAVENQVVGWVWPCVCSQTWSVWTDCMRSGWCLQDCVICLHLLIWITKHNNIFKTLDTFAVFLGSLNHKNLILGNSPLASSPMAVGIDRRSIPTAGDNHSVSASTDPNSYLGLLTASMAQMTTGTQISFYCSKAPSGHLGGNVFMSQTYILYHPLDAYTWS